MDYKPSSLFAVDRVEVVRLEEKDQSPGVMSILGAREGVFVEDEVAQEIARLWRALPFTEQNRCHFPPFALRFFGEAGLILTASLCWHCNNIWITENGQRKYAEFDADADVSQQLLRLLEEVAPPHLNS